MSQETEALDSGYEAAFAEALGEAPSQAAATEPVEPAAAPADPQAVVEPTAEAETESAEPAAEAVEPADEPGATPAAEQEPAAVQQAPAPAAQPLDPKYLAAAIAEAQQQIAAQQSQPAQPTDEPAREATLEDFLDDGAKAAVESFKKDWPTEFQAITALVTASMKAAVANGERQSKALVEQAVAPIATHVQQSQVTYHQSTIASRHPDFGPQMAKDLASWIATQHPLHRPAYERVYQSGSTQDVVELISLYKEATGKTGAAPAAPAPSTQPAAAKPQPKPVDRTAVAATAAPPAARRTAPATQKDPQNFVSAFQEALNEAS